MGEALFQQPKQEKACLDLDGNSQSPQAREQGYQEILQRVGPQAQETLHGDPQR